MSVMQSIATLSILIFTLSVVMLNVDMLSVVVPL
jgi:hypothetical protein